MSCKNVQERISLLLDCKLQSSERELVLAHLEACRQCCSRFESMESMRSGLRQMAQPTVPPELVAKLRVIASHECARQNSRKTPYTRVRNAVSTIRLVFDNLMRPFAVPVTGGVASAFVLFSLLVPSLSFPHSHSYEPPIAGADADVQWGDPQGDIIGLPKGHARLEVGSAEISGNEVSLTLLIDERGYVRDYYLSSGELTEEMKSLILLSQFTPATVSGQPTWGLKQVVFDHSRRLRS
jgi:hypothetical protein